MVSVSEDAALIMRDVDNDSRYITHAQFLASEDVYWEGAYELEHVIMEVEEDDVKVMGVAREVFSPTTLEGIADASGRFCCLNEL